MLNRIYVLSAAVFAAGVFVAAGVVTADEIVTSETTVTHSPDLAGDLPAGITAKNLNDDKAIEKTFKSLTDDAITKNGFDNVVSLLVDQDRTRIKDSIGKGHSLTNLSGDDNKKLNDQVNAFKQLWKDKYGKDFSPDYEIFGNNLLGIKTGEVSDPAALVGHWPLDVSMMVPNADAGKMNASDLDQARKMFGGEVNLEKGRNVAIAHFPMGHEMPGLNISMIHEAGGWKFDIPNNIDSGRLYTNLTDNLDYVYSHKDRLPSDINDGYREVSHAVVAALYNVDLTKITPTAGLPGQGARPSEGSAENR